MSSVLTHRAELATGRGLADDVAETVFAAMGTQAHVVVVDGPAGLLDDARRLVDELEGHWSRFRPDSDVSRLNRADGSWVAVNADTMVLLDRARAGWEVTQGRFDPTVLPAVVAAGYDTTFEAVAARAATVSPETRAVAGRPRPAPGLAGLELDWHRRRVRLPAGVAVDPGAIGKGLAADLVVELLLAHGAAGAMANLGGDLRAAGRGPRPGGWGVEIVVPGRGDTVLVALDEAAVATSTPAYRRWQRHGRSAHHLVDPATGSPATSPARSATVIAGTAWLAEVLATSLVLHGPRDPLPGLGATGLVQEADGTCRPLPGFEEYRR